MLPFGSGTRRLSRMVDKTVDPKGNCGPQLTPLDCREDETKRRNYSLGRT